MPLEEKQDSVVNLSAFSKSKKFLEITDFWRKKYITPLLFSKSGPLKIQIFATKYLCFSEDRPYLKIPILAKQQC